MQCQISCWLLVYATNKYNIDTKPPDIWIWSYRTYKPVHTGRNKYLSYVGGFRHPLKNKKIKHTKISKQTWLNMSSNKTGLQHITWVKVCGKLCFYWVGKRLLKLHYSDIIGRWWCWWIQHLTTYCMKSEVESFDITNPMVIKIPITCYMFNIDRQTKCHFFRPYNYE